MHQTTGGRAWCYRDSEWCYPSLLCRGCELATLQARLVAGEASDGSHTHNELYEYRMLYHAHAAACWSAAGIPVVKSWNHSDGAPCFGGGWFIVTAELPTGQVSNHYRGEHWDLFAVPSVSFPPEWDGHTPAEAAERLRTHLMARMKTDPECIGDCVDSTDIGVPGHGVAYAHPWCPLHSGAPQEPEGEEC